MPWRSRPTCPPRPPPGSPSAPRGRSSAADSTTSSRPHVTTSGSSERATQVRKESHRVIEDHGQQPSWREFYQGGSEQAEQDHFRDLADRIVGVQQENERRSGSHAARRTFHAKIVIGVDNAERAFPADLPAGLRAGDFTAGARLPVTVRLSNASGAIRPDSSPDLR